MEVVEKKYYPVYFAMRGVGNLLKSKRVEEYPGLVRKLRKDVDRTW